MRKGLLKLISAPEIVEGMKAFLFGRIVIIRKVAGEFVYINNDEPEREYEEELAEYEKYPGFPSSTPREKKYLQTIIIEAFPEGKDFWYLNTSDWDYAMNNSMVDNQRIVFYELLEEYMNDPYNPIDREKVAYIAYKEKIKSQLNYEEFNVEMFYNGEYSAIQKGKLALSEEIIKELICKFVYEVATSKEKGHYIENYLTLMTEVKEWFDRYENSDVYR